MTDRRTARLALDLTALPRTVPLTLDVARTIQSTPAAGLGGAYDWLYHALDTADRDEVLRAMLVHCGAAAALNSDHDLFHAKPEVADKLGMYHATARLWGRRTAIRYNRPDSTPFMIARTTSNQVGVWFEGDRVGLGDIMEPEATCLRNLSYYSDGRERTRDATITINPIQSCALRCRFCRRQYDHLDRNSEPLINLTPTDTANHLIAKYPHVDWGSRVRISLVTGTFADFEHLWGWIADFTLAMGIATDGAWQPSEHEGQLIHILSHLARTREEMWRLRELGVKSYQDTAEIVNDDRRRELMPKANERNRRLLGKGQVRWADVLRAVSYGRDVFGERNYSVTLILGLDTRRDTVAGLNQLLAEGLVVLDRPLYQAFEVSGLDLYAMSAMDLAEASVLAGRLFDTQTTDWDPERFVLEERRLPGR